MAEMTNWQKPGTRRHPKTKAELQQMLADAIRNTQLAKDEAAQRPAQEIAIGTSSIDQAGTVTPTQGQMQG